MSDLMRRTFLAAGGAAGLATAAGGPNDRVTVGLIGCGGQGNNLANAFAGLPNVEVAWLCDPDQAQIDRAAKTLNSAKIRTTKDLRQVLDDRDLDAVLIATPDHWHSPAAILACDAGKHVYVEKPCSHNLREGRLLVETARRTKRLVQHGTQARSSPTINRGVQLLREGAIGDVLVAKAWNVQGRKSIGREPPTEPPASLDYDLWVGPAPMVPYQRNLLHSSWRWFTAFGCGDIGNDGVHELDIARWGLGVAQHPHVIAAVGGKYFFDDDQQFPDTQYVSFEYSLPGGGKRQLVFEQRLWSPYAVENVENGCAFYGTKGWLMLAKHGDLRLYDVKHRLIKHEKCAISLPAHAANFVAALRDGAKLAADAEIAHLSASLSHLGNIATRLGRTLRFDPAQERFINDGDADRLLGREYRAGHWAVPRTG